MILTIELNVWDFSYLSFIILVTYTLNLRGALKFGSQNNLKRQTVYLNMMHWKGQGAIIGQR